MIRVGDYKITQKDKDIVMKVLESGQLSEGKMVREFEQRWAEFVGTKYCVLTNSGTSALIACLEVFKEYTKNRYIATSPLTFIATINAIILSGYEPIFNDVDRQTFTVKPFQVNADIFIPVHLYGYPVDMDKFIYKYTIEDACEAHGSIYNGRKVGSIGDMGCYSFYIAHNIQVGDMGAVTTNNKELYEKLRAIKAHGRLCKCFICTRTKGTCPYKDKQFDPRFTHTVIAYNFKTTEIQAALGINQVEIADEIIKKRQENVKYLNNGLQEITHILQLPQYDTKVSYLAYPLIVKEPGIVHRNRLCKELETKGIETRPLFACVPTQQPAYEYMKAQWEGKLPNAEWLGANGLHIGCHQYMTQEDLDYIIKTIKGVICAQL